MREFFIHPQLFKTIGSQSIYEFHSGVERRYVFYHLGKHGENTSSVIWMVTASTPFADRGCHSNAKEDFIIWKLKEF